MNISESKIQEMKKEIADAQRMYDAIFDDPRRKIDQPCEKLHYWDGKRTGLQLALCFLGVK